MFSRSNDLLIHSQTSRRLYNGSVGILGSTRYVCEKEHKRTHVGSPISLSRSPMHITHTHV